MSDPLDTDSGSAWALLIARAILGLIFAMAGWWKVFELGPFGHAERFFLSGFADTWIPTALLWALGVTIPFVELLAGVAMIVGWRVREAGLGLGAVLVLVTYGHLLLDPLFDTTAHIFPRTVLLVFVLAYGGARDRLSLDARSRSRSLTDRTRTPAGEAK